MTRRAVVIPCGGSAVRLNIPYAKELHAVGSGKPLIEFALSLADRLVDPMVAIVVVNRDKPELIRYLLGRDSKFPILFTAQLHPEFLGALRSAIPFLKECNMILLPDQVIVETGALEAAYAALEQGAPAVALAAHVEDRTKLADDGAMYVLDGRVRAIAEKPGPETTGFNAAWCALGFRREYFSELLEFLDDLYSSRVISEEQWKCSPLFHAPVFMVERYLDLGTWARIKEFQSWT